MERKDFLKSACGLCGIALLPSYLLTGCKKTDVGVPAAGFSIDLSQATYAGLNTVGNSMVVNQILIINTASGFVALQAACTHQGCTVGYQNASQHIVCPCHGGTFDTNGTVLSGPPPNALHKYAITQTGTVLAIA